jgi:hypothetical protein
MIDKGRAQISGHVGTYWFGDDSGFDRRLLELLGLSAEAFADGLKQHPTDAELVAWLGDRLQGREGDIAAYNHCLVELGPGSNDRARAFLTEGVKATDAARHDVGTFMVMARLDDEIFLARLRASV